METQHYDLLNPLPGWLRFRNMQNGTHIDINPCDDTHQQILPFYMQHPQWQLINEGARPKPRQAVTLQ